MLKVNLARFHLLIYIIVKAATLLTRVNTLQLNTYTLFDGLQIIRADILRVAKYFSEPRRGEKKCER